jgi:hypothetical protein
VKPLTLDLVASSELLLTVIFATARSVGAPAPAEVMVSSRALHYTGSAGSRDCAAKYGSGHEIAAVDDEAVCRPLGDCLDQGR